MNSDLQIEHCRGTVSVIRTELKWKGICISYMYVLLSLFNLGASLKVLILVCVGAVSSSTEL